MDNGQESNDSARRFAGWTSALDVGSSEAFVSNMLGFAISIGARSLEPLFTEYLDALMTDMSAHSIDGPERTLRNALIKKAGGPDTRIARRYEAQASTTNIRMGLEEQVTTPTELCDLITDLDLLVTASPATAWKLLASAVEGILLANSEADSAKSDLSKTDTVAKECALLLRMLTDVLNAELFSAEDIVDGLGIGVLRAGLKADALGDLVEFAYTNKTSGLTANDVLNVVMLERLCTPESPFLLDFWLSVFEKRFAEPRGWIKRPEPPPPSQTVMPPVFGSSTPPAKKTQDNATEEEVPMAPASVAPPSQVRDDELEEVSAEEDGEGFAVVGNAVPPGDQPPKE